jgi:uncharacterized protein (TIGR02646 family)
MRYVQRTDYVNQNELTSQKEEYLLELSDYFKVEQFVRPPKYQNINLKSLKPHLLNQFNQKCAFCESKISEKTSTIEHFRPNGGARRHNGQVDNAFYVWLALDWDNLYSSCRTCSISKANNFPVNRTGRVLMPLQELRDYEVSQIIDPCYLDPNQSIKLKRNGTLESNNFLGEQTINILSLNRENLVLRRKKVIQDLTENINKYLQKEEPNWHLADEITESLSRNGEFSGLLSDFIRSKGVLRRSALRKLSDLVDFTSTPINVIRRTQTTINNTLSKNKNSLNDRRSNQFFSISHIEISGFKGIKYFSTDINLLEGKGACYAFLGINGLGKTTILQALTLGLLGSKRINHLDFKSFKRFGLNSKDLIHKDCKKAKIIISFNNNEYSNELVITKSFASYFRADIPADTRRVDILGRTEFEPCVLSYGAFRLPAKSPLKDNLSNATGFRIQSMFNETARINGVQGIFSKHKGRNSLIAIADILESILGSEGIRFEVSIKNKLLIKRYSSNNEYENISFNILSSGYQTIVTVVCDILDVLLGVEQDGISSLESTQAFVLIDELDAHLHPSWKLKILQSFRDALPLIHFYVSTHDPLILRSLNEGELLILKINEETKLIAIDNYPSLKGASVDQLLTSAMFGLHTTQDIETERAIQKYYDKLEKIANDSNKGNSSIVIDKVPSLEELGIMSDVGLTRRDRMLMRLVDLEIVEHRNNFSFSEWSSESVNSLFEKAKSLGMIDDS